MFYQAQAKKCQFLSLVTLTFDLQTCPSEGPNTSSMWIWRKSIQQFIYKQKPQTDGVKNRIFRSLLHVVMSMIISVPGSDDAGESV